MMRLGAGSGKCNLRHRLRRIEQFGAGSGVSL